MSRCTGAPTVIATVVPPSASEVRAADRRFAASLKKARELAKWASFGTIGFAAYVEWILTEESRRPVIR